MSAFVERALFVVGLSCLGWFGLAAADAAYTQHEARAAIERVLDATTPESAVVTGGRSLPRWEEDGSPALGSNLVGLLEIPRLGMSAPVVEGDDSNALRAAAGHLPDTPRPWEAGNSAIAAHRDGIFRPLRDIRAGDELRVRTPHGDFRYQVTSTRIVEPTDLSVLEPTDTHTLTLITCYPFNYVGSAPKRFIVRAERIGAHP
jgi:LPXTG-site transpeptidase (sortase) family protein